MKLSILPQLIYSGQSQWNSLATYNQIPKFLVKKHKIDKNILKVKNYEEKLILTTFKEHNKVMSIETLMKK